MKKALLLQFLFLVLFTQCEMWNQPMASSIEEQFNELKAIHTILVKTEPTTVFVEGEEPNIPQSAENWEAQGLIVGGVNGLNEMRELTPEEYSVELIDPPKSPLVEPINYVDVKVTLNDSDITTGFLIAILKAGEKYYTIEPYTDPVTGGTVFANPSVILGSEMEAAEETDVYVSIIISPANNYDLTGGSLACFKSLGSEKIPLGLPVDNKYKFTKSFFQEQDNTKSKYTTYLYAGFELVEGAVRMNGEYYDTLEKAIDAIPENSGSNCTITVVTGFSLSRPLTIPLAGKNIKNITLESTNTTIKKINSEKNNVTIADGGTLELKTVESVGGALTVNGTITVSGSGGLEMAGAVSVTQVALENDAVITVSGALSPSGGVPLTKITGKSSGIGIVLQGGGSHQLTVEDCARFIVDGYAIELEGNTGVLMDRVASRWENGVEKYYGSIQDAVESSKGTEHLPDTITVLNNIPVDDARKVTIGSGKYVKLVPKFGSDKTLTRAAGFDGSLFTVASGGSLTLEGNGIHSLVIDGNKSNITASASLITVESGGGLTLNTGAILRNNNTSGDGGGVYVYDGGTFTMKGGVISGNEATGNGDGVYVNGAFTVSGSAVVAQDNDVYLASGKVITVGKLDSKTTPVAKINPEVETADTKVLEPAQGINLTDAGIRRFTLGIPNMVIILKDNVGVLSSAVVSRKKGNETVYYDSIQSAVNVSNGTPNNPDTIIVLATEITVEDAGKVTINSGKYVRLVPNTDSTATVKRASGFDGSLFTVASGGSLTLARNGAVGFLVIDGNKSEIMASGSLIRVESGGRLTINTGAKLLNNSNSGDGGAVRVDDGGAFIMSDGEISGNTAMANGGAVYVANGNFTMSGGVISGNTAGNGGAVYVTKGTFSMSYNGATISGNTASASGGGVYVDERGTFTMLNGAVSGNTAATNGGGVYAGSGTFTMSGGTIGGGNAANGGGVYVGGATFSMSSAAKISGNTASASGGGVYAGSGTFTMSGGTIGGDTTSAANTARDGGGVYAGGGTFSMSSDAKISGNTATTNGGGIYVGVYFDIFTGTISGNNAANGGGVYVGYYFAMSAGTIRDNNAANGGGVYIPSGSTLTMSGGTISGNTAITGGGVYATDSGFMMSGSAAISGNAATGNGGGVVYTGEGEFNMSGSSATIRGNTANGNGGGVYVNGKFKVSGLAVVDQDNDVYLASGKVITVGELSGNTLAAKITPEVKTAGTQVLTPAEGIDLTDADIRRFFTLDIPEMVIERNENGDGILADAIASLDGVSYSSIQKAVDDSNGTLGSPDTITVLKSINVDGETKRVTIDNGKHIKLVPKSGLTVTLRRASGFGDALVAVGGGGSLTLEGNGSAGLVLDGGNVTAHAPLIVTGGRLTINTGVTLKNNNRSGDNGNGGGVHIENGGTFTMQGSASISGNTAGNGGGVHIDNGGTFTMQGSASISGNTATANGGGVFVQYGGMFTMSGGAISGNRASNGGGVFVEHDGAFTMQSGAAIGDNTATGNGGGVFIENDGTFTMVGGVIGGNTATGNGGGVYVNGTFTMSGGVIDGTNARNSSANGGGVFIEGGAFTMQGSASISGNTASGNGGGVFAGGGTFTMSDSATVAQNNDVYLANGNVITVGATLSGTGYVAMIKPEDERADTIVLDGLSAATITRFNLSITDMVIVLNESRGVLKNAIVSLNGVAYSSIQDAVDASAGTSSATPDTITVLAENITVEDTGKVTINSGKHVKLVPGANSDVTLTRAGNFTDAPLFTISSGGSLALAGISGRELVVDGNSANNVTAHAPLIKVQGGSFTIDTGVTLKNNNHQGNCGGVLVTGSGSSFTMNGGAISGNSATTGGGVFVQDGAFTMAGGAISGNTTDDSGGGVYVGGGTFMMQGGASISGNTTSNSGGGVYVNGNGAFTMQGSASISGNTASNGGGVYVGGGVFTVSGLATVDQNNEVYLASGNWITVGSLSGSATVAKIRPANTVTGTTVLTPQTSVTLTDAVINRFALDISGKMIVLLNNAGVLADKVASRQVGGTEKFYPSIQAAVDASSGGSSTSPVEITLLKSINIDDTSKVTINSGIHVKLAPTSGLTVTLTRASGFTGNSLFTISSGGSLTLAGISDRELVIDGNKNGVSAAAPLIKVSGGTFTMNNGVTLQNNNRSGSGSAGSGVYLNGGAFTMSGGTIRDNVGGSNGCGVNINGGTFTMSGGTISGNTTGDNGGGVYVGGNGAFTMQSGTISGNTASNGGGGVYIDSTSTSTMSGGTISGNGSRDGGGVYVRSTFNMSGGAISGNTATSDNGGGVFMPSNSSATFTMSGSAVVAQDNEVFLETAGNWITVGALNSGTTPVAKIRPKVTTDNTPVLKPQTGVTLTDTVINRFALAISGKMIVLLNNAGVLADVVASRSVGGTEKYYPSIQAAVDDSSGGSSANPVEITLLKSIDVDDTSKVTINNDKHVKLVPKSGLTVTLTQAAGFTANSLFTINSGGSLALAGNVSAGLMIDGNKATVTATAPLIKVSGGTFTMNNGVTLKDNNQSATSGGGVYISDNGVFTMEGGTISGNTVSVSGSGGGGVYVSGNGTFTMKDGTISGNTAYRSGGGVSVYKGTFTMEGGTISGNSGYYGGGVCVSDGMFTKSSGGTIYGSNAETALKNTADRDDYGHAAYVFSQKKRNTTADGSVTLDSSKSGGDGGWE
jgi:hypothetical protein